MIKKEKVLLSSLEKFIEYAKTFSKKIKPGNVIVLSGDLGVGKTTFTKAVCEALGVKKVVTSPTFTFMKSYQSDIGMIYHYDLYRISSLDEVYELGLEENLHSGGVSFIEWNKFTDIAADYIIHIDKTQNDNERSIEIEYALSNN